MATIATYNVPKVENESNVGGHRLSFWLLQRLDRNGYNSTPPKSLLLVPIFFLVLLGFGSPEGLYIETLRKRLSGT